MKNRIFLTLAILVLFVCLFTTMVSATDGVAEEVNYDLPYYDKVYVDSTGKELALYEKVEDTYYPLVWFKYEDENGEAKYVKVHFEDVTTNSLDASNGRLNGISYVYTDENDAEITLMSKDVVLLNLRGGKLSTNGKAIRKIEQRGDNSSFSKVEAIYLPLTLDGSFGWCLSYSTLRVLDFDRNHSTPVNLQQHIIDGTKVKEIFIPGCATFSGNCQFQNCTSLEKIVFGEGFNANNLSDQMLMGYTFANCGNLKMVCFMGDYVEANQNNNGVYPSMTKLSAEEYLALEDKSGKYKIYNCTECIAFGHKAGDSYTSVGDYFGTTVIKSVCPACSDGVAVTELGAMFKWLGYSCSEFADAKGCYSVMQGFGINRSVVEEYVSYCPDFEYGVVAAVGKTTPLSVVGGVVTAGEGVICAKIGKSENGQVNSKHDYFDIKVTGIQGPSEGNEGKLDVEIVFNAYVAANGNVYYLSSNATYETAQSISYNNAK